MKCEEEKSRSDTFTVSNICEFLRRVYVCISTSVIFFFLSFSGFVLVSPFSQSVVIRHYAISHKIRYLHVCRCGVRHFAFFIFFVSFYFVDFSTIFQVIGGLVSFFQLLTFYSTVRFFSITFSRLLGRLVFVITHWKSGGLIFS